LKERSISLLDLVASFLVRGINIFFHIMPIRFNLWLGRRFGAMMYILSGRRAKITYANLKAAFWAEKTPQEINRITKSAYRNMAQTFAEILSMTKCDKRYIDKYVVIHNPERIKQASENPRGAIFTSAHFGNWELVTAVSAMIGFPLHLLVREQKMERLNEL
jgi:KDO2-lipid IV(A) lauroyltransferase